MLRTLPGPGNILQKQFPNGVTVLIHENPWSSTAALCGSLPAGYGLDALAKPGVSAFVSSALMAGTRTRTFEQVGDFLDSIGAVLTFSTDPDVIRFNGNCLCEDLPDLLVLLKEILDKSAFPEHCLEVLRCQALGGYDEDDHEDGAYMSFKGILWGQNHPYGRIKEGMNEDIRNITRDDLVNFHKRFFGPKDLIISLSGGFRGREIMDRCEEIFGSWDKTQEDVDEDGLFAEAIGEDCECIIFHLDLPERKEVSLVMGTFGPAGGDSDLLPLQIGNSIFGGFELTDRIGQVIREKHGLAYSVCSALDPWKKGGCWSVAAGIDPANLEKAGGLILDEIRRFTAEPVSPQELEDARSRYIARLPLSFEDNACMALGIYRLAFYHRDIDYWLRAPERAGRITPASLLETVRKWIDPGKLVIITAGPRDGDKANTFWWPPVYSE